MFKRPELSKLIYSKKQIVIHSFKKNMIHPGNFILLDFNKINYHKNLNLKKSNVTVGKFQCEIHHKDESSIYLYFENLLPDFNFDNFWASLQFSAKILQCPTCKTFFSKNDTPCKCIQGAPFYYVSEITVEAVHLHSFKSDYYDSYDCRKVLYSEFFNRSLHNITLMEPI